MPQGRALQEAFTSLSPSQIVSLAVRQERERLGLSASELAKRARVAKSTLSQLESGQGNPSLETLWALSAVLGVPVSRLIEAPRREMQVVRAGEGAATRAERADFAAVLLSAAPGAVRRDIYRVDVQPGAAYRSDAHPPRTSEHLMLIAGRARVGPDESPVEVGPGDYVAYAADTVHRYEALVPDTVALLVVEHA